MHNQPRFMMTILIFLAFPGQQGEKLGSACDQVCYPHCMATEIEQLSDQQLWHQHCADREGAFDELLGRHRNKLKIYVQSRAQNVAASIDDIIQNSLLKMHQVKGKFDGTNFIGYLIRIASREIVDHYREQQRHSASEWVEAAAVDEDSANGLALLVAREASQEKQTALRECLESVDQTFVRIFLMKIRDGLSGAEIAQREGIAEGTVHSRTNRAKASLKDCVEGKLS